MQIHTKLTLQFLLLVFILLLCSLYFFYSKFYEQVIKEQVGTLRSQSTNIASRVLSNAGTFQRDTIKPGHDEFNVKSNIIIYDVNFTKIFSLNSNDWQLSPQDINSLLQGSEVCSSSPDGLIKLAYTLNHNNTDKFIVLAFNGVNKDALNRIKSLLFLTILIGMMIASIGGWWYTKQALQPVKNVVTQVESMLPSNLGARILGIDTKDEIDHLIHTFNKLLDRIEEAFKMQKNFISNVSHELKNPISSITSQLELLLSSENKISPEDNAYIKSILEDTFRINDTIENLLQLARIQSEDGGIQFDVVRLDEILIESRNLLKRSNSDYAIDIEIIGDPESEKDFYVRGNKSLLTSAMMNIMDNCCKYSSNKYVDVKMILKNKMILLEMSDDGPGISPEDVQLIFKPFYRDPRNYHKKGFGIGLSLVNTVMKIHQFKLEVASKEDKGSVFKIYIPNS
ncbi:MAG: HAMP domain-containing sensor histidine kinase [Saprospiraceae bacterium]